MKMVWMMLVVAMCGCDNSHDNVWEDRLDNSRNHDYRMTEVTLVGASDSDVAGVRFTLREKADLQSLYDAMRDPPAYDQVTENVIMGQSQNVFVDYMCVFSDGVTLQDEGVICLFEDQAFLQLFYPGDTGFQGDLYALIPLNGICSDEAISTLRDTYSDDMRVPLWPMQTGEGKGVENETGLTPVP